MFYRACTHECRARASEAFRPYISDDGSSSDDDGMNSESSVETITPVSHKSRSHDNMIGNETALHNVHDIRRIVSNEGKGHCLMYSNFIQLRHSRTVLAPNSVVAMRRREI